MTPVANLDRLGDLVSTLGSQNFGSAFYRLFQSIFDVEECTVFSFPREAVPVPVLVEGRCNARQEMARQLAAEYVSEGYRHDPNLDRDHQNVTVYTADARNIGNSVYRARYYDGPALAHELVVLGEAGDSLYYTSFYRTQDAARFQHRDIEAVSQLAGFLIKSLHRHRELSQPLETGHVATSHAMQSKESRDRTFAHMREVLLVGPHRLSPREAEVCAGIILGYSTLAISLNCSITPNTVATHRKRAYAKLGISSQNELFTRYFHNVREFNAREMH